MPQQNYDSFYIGKPCHIEYRPAGTDGIGEDRHVIPLELQYGVLSGRPEPQWYLHCFDLVRDSYRTFPFNEIRA